MNPLAVLARPSRDYETPSTHVHIEVPRRRRSLIGALSAGTFILVIISIVLGLAFFTILPAFTTTAIAALNATTDAAAITMLELIPFVVAALFIAFAVLYLIKEFKGM